MRFAQSPTASGLRSRPLVVRVAPKRFLWNWNFHISAFRIRGLVTQRTIRTLGHCCSSWTSSWACRCWPSQSPPHSPTCRRRDFQNTPSRSQHVEELAENWGASQGAVLRHLSMLVNVWWGLTHPLDDRRRDLVVSWIRLLLSTRGDRKWTRCLSIVLLVTLRC